VIFTPKWSIISIPLLFLPYMSFQAFSEESQLVKSLAGSNILAFNALYKGYSNRLYRFAYGYLKSKGEAEELVQEVFLKIWDKRKDLKEELSFRSFLFTIAFNMIRRHFRTKVQLNKYFQTLKSEDQDNITVQNINYNSLHKYITELVDLLPDRRREIFIKSRFEGLSIQEIARELNISHKTVENQLSDAIKFIRTRINNESLAILLFFILFIS
jgi:RNA polymerase sigma-70 factor (family 1)